MSGEENGKLFQDEGIECSKLWSDVTRWMGHSKYYRNVLSEYRIDVREINLGEKGRAFCMLDLEVWVEDFELGNSMFQEDDLGSHV